MDTTIGRDDFENILAADETVLIFAEEKIFHPDIDVDSVAVTNERIILHQPHSPGTRADFTDIRYSEIEGVGLAKGRSRFTIKFKFRDGRDPLELGFPSSSLAKEAHGIISANLNLLPERANENAETSQAHPDPSGVDDAKEVRKEIAPADEDAVADEDLKAVVSEEEAVLSGEAIPKRRKKRHRSVPAQIESSAEEVSQEVAPASRDAEVQAPEKEAPDEGETSQEREKVTDTPTKETVESAIPSTGDGWIDINGKRYEHDVIVHTDGSVTKRDKSLSKSKKAKYGHTPLTGKEVKVLLKETPDLVIIGIGQTGALPITPKAEKLLESVPCIIAPTPEAMRWLIGGKRKSVALFHVTC